MSKAGATADSSTVFMFSGQGSQYFHMGSDLYQSDPGFRSRLQRLDAMAMDLFGLSPLAATFAPDKRLADAFDDSLRSSLSIFSFERALADLLISRGVQPAALLGSSLGMFAAAVVAGCLEEETALKYIHDVDRVFRETCPPGRMIAIIAPLRVYDELLAPAAACELAAVNFDSSFVIALPAAHLATVEACLERNEVLYQVLPVRFPYHSRWIDAAAPGCRALFSGLQHRIPAIPLLSCTEQCQVRSFDADSLWQAIRGRLLFHAPPIARLEATGPHRYVDVGPSGMLATFLKYVLPPSSRSRVFPILTPFRQSAARLQELLTQDQCSAPERVPT